MNARPEELAPAERYVFPASFAQQRLWFLEQLDGARPVWNVRLPVRLDGALDVRALEQAVAVVVARHESLRTTFGMRGGEILQFVASTLAVPVEQVAMRGATEEEMRQRLGELAAHTFDLREGPLLRVFLVERAAGEHVLLLLSHHIVSDAWSSGVLFQDLSAAYRALASGRQPELPDLPVQYADFAVWQREWLAGAELEQQVSFWRQHLTAAPALLDLPLDRPRPRLQSYRGNRLGHGLSPEQSAQLKRLAIAEGVTPFMLLFAAFNVLLARWSGQGDLVVGTPIAGRRRTELEGLVGFFANTLALRTRVDVAGTFRELLRQVRATSLEAFSHQDLPFEKLVEVLKPPRSLAYSPLFQVMFSLQNTPWESGAFGDLSVAPAEMAAGGTARFDLAVSVSDFEGRLWLGLEYSTDLFAVDTIQRLAIAFETLLAAIVAEPTAVIGSLPVQSDVDRRRQLYEWQPPATGDAPASDVYALFAAQARRIPDAIAVECGDLRLDYAELEARAAGVAARLQAAGMNVQTPVAICLERAPDMLVALLGVLRAGGHYLPLDPGHPVARRALVLEDSGAELLLTSAALASQFSGFGGRVLDVAAVPSTAAIPPAAPASTPAYLIYTSGSTGRPKGVVVSQRAVVNFLVSMAREPGLRSRDRLLAVTTLAFDIAVLELLLPLAVGATTVIARDDDVRDPSRLIRLLDARAITVLQATPATFRNLITAGWRGRAGLRLYCGGEALDRELADRLLPLGAELWNLYGPTETTVWSCVERVAEDDGPVAIGRPIDNTRCYVLDEQLQPVPIGARGELWIGGAGVALGYHSQPELTAQCFQPDRINPIRRGDRMYRTGDRARWLADGRLDVLGRTDFQLKLRGFRIEPGEVEAALLAHAAVREAVVVLRDMAGDARLVAYLVACDQPLPDDELMATLRLTLPVYMLPSTIVWLAALPLTPNGKVDRAALPSPAVMPAGTQMVAVQAAPSGGELALHGIFSELLGVPVGPDDDFFARGGHSLLATRLVARVAADLRVTLPLRAVFETPTVRGLAASLPPGLPEGSVVAAPSGPAAGERWSPATLEQQEAAPLSLVQQRLWFLDRLQPGNPAYHLAWAFELRGVADRRALQSALDVLAARHGSLRSHFRERDGQPEQVVEVASGWPLEFLTADPADVAQITADAAAEPFDLATGPLARALLIGSAPEVHTLLIVVHHIVADGWSLGVLSRDLAVAYAAARRGEAVALPALRRDYAGYAREQRRALGSGGLARQLGYWQTQLHDSPPFLELPTDRPRPVLPSPRGARYSGLLPAALQAELHNLARAEGCTLFTVLLAAFDVLLARYAGTEDVVVGTPVAGRPDSELEGLVGFFVNTLVLRTKLGGNPTVRDLLVRVREMTLAAWEHAEVPFEMLVEVLQPPRSTSRTPLFQVLFNLHSEPVVPLALAGLAVQPVAVPRHTAKFELSVSLAETAAGIAVSVEYSTDLFLPASVKRLVADYAVLLGGFVAVPDARLSDLPFSPSAAEAPTAPTVPSGSALTLPAAFAAQLAKNPAALAVSAPATAARSAIDWTYGDLAIEAAAVVAALAGCKVQPGERVGLWFGHGAGQVAGMLGVLQAGAVYVPLDPLAPPSRLAAIIGDAGINVVLTDTEAPAWPVPGPVVVVLDNLRREPGTAVAAPTIHPDSLAYLLYTSGSTGAPKGVPQTHRNVLHFIRSWAGNLGITADDRLSLLATAGYDAAVQDIFGALLTGASVCPLDVRRLDRETLLDRIADRRLSILHGTPTVYRYLFGGHVACRQDLSHVRLVVLGGEAARRADFELFRARFGKAARFVNGYGLTEATAVTQWFAGKDAHPYGQQLPIGRPLADGQGLQLLDETGAPAPFIGEIVLDSVHVTPGYWPVAAEAATATESGVNRRFHTGDLARFLPDGNLVYIGRRDERLKIGGIRIEAGDIEAGLRTHAAIDDAVVMAVTDTSGEPVLLAWYTLRAGAASLTVTTLRSHLGTLLPAAMIPARFTACPELPRLPNGKVDRRALAQLGAASAATPVAGPSNGGTAEGVTSGPEVSHIQATVRDIWRSLLHLEHVGPDDDFFALGGHSLLATRLVARIRDRLGIELPLIRIFESPTVRGLADFLASQRIQAREPGSGPN